MPTTIRPATPSDAHYINDINRATWLETYGNPEIGITQEYVDSLPTDPLARSAFIARKEKEIAADGNCYFMAMDGDAPVGYASGKICPDETFNEFTAIYILPEFQGKCIGIFVREKRMVLKKHFEI